MAAVDTANEIAGHALTVAIVAGVIALAAAAFSAWQAYTAHKVRMADNHRALVEWEPATWPSPEVVEIKSKGPDTAWEVWARLTLNGEVVEVREDIIHEGDSLKFSVPALAESWDLHRRLAVRGDEPWVDVTAFYWGVVITWKSRYGRSDGARPEGSMRRRIRYSQEPDLPDELSPGHPASFLLVAPCDSQWAARSRPRVGSKLPWSAVRIVGALSQELRRPRAELEQFPPPTKS